MQVKDRGKSLNVVIIGSPLTIFMFFF